MVSLICGGNGTGKTCKMIEMANNEIEKVQGKMVFIEVNSRHLFDLDYRIRYINTSEYNLSKEEQFYGFICGLLATDYDIEVVYVDGLYKITESCKLQEPKEMVKRLEKLSSKFNVKFVLSLNCSEEEIPNEIKENVFV